jgi:hypothetical protein
MIIGVKKWRKSIRGELANGWDDAPGIVDEMESGVEYASWSSARQARFICCTPCIRTISQVLGCRNC